LLVITISGLRVQVSRRALLVGLAGAIAVALAATSVVLVAARGGRTGAPAAAAARTAATATTAATAEAAAAVVSSGGGSQQSAPTPTPTGSAAVPWVDKPGTPQSLPVSASAGRPCRAADLDIAAGLTGAFQGLVTQELTLRDRAADACFLAGAPQVVLTNAGARSRVSPGQFAAKRLDLASGSSAGLVVGTPAACAGSGQPVVATSVLLTLPTGDAVTVGGTRIDTECGAATVVEFGAADLLPAATPGPLDALSATLDAPQTVARGAVLTYHVTLVNQSPASVTLSPCPSYTEVLGAARQTLVLNCQAGASIAANASVTYEMKLTVPASAPPGDSKLSWTLEVPDGPVAGTVITVT
jgi:trimeric autotransporter adhesin